MGHLISETKFKIPTLTPPPLLISDKSLKGKTWVNKVVVDRKVPKFDGWKVEITILKTRKYFSGRKNQRQIWNKMSST